MSNSENQPAGVSGDQTINGAAPGSNGASRGPVLPAVNVTPPFPQPHDLQKQNMMLTC